MNGMDHYGLPHPSMPDDLAPLSADERRRFLFGALLFVAALIALVFGFAWLYARAPLAEAPAEVRLQSFQRKERGAKYGRSLAGLPVGQARSFSPRLRVA